MDPDRSDTGGGAPRKFVIATAIDAEPALSVELILWAICVRRHLPSEIFKPVVYLIGEVADDLARWLCCEGVTVRRAAAPVDGVPHCNRLAAFLDEHEDCEYVLVTDADLYLLVDPLPLFRRGDQIRAAPNNGANPPARIFKRIIAESGLVTGYRPTMVPLDMAVRETHINNVNAGMIALPAAMARLFGTAWQRWALWLRERRHLMERWSGHIDQVSFALTCDEYGEDVVFLPPQINLMMHFLTKVDTLYGLHISRGHVGMYPNRFNIDRTLEVAGLAPSVEAAVKNLNGCLLEACRIGSDLPSVKGAVHTLFSPR